MNRLPLRYRIHFLVGDTRLGRSVFRRFEESADIRQLRQDEADLDAFFRQHFRAAEPANDMWPQIARRLDEPGTRPLPFAAPLRPAPRTILTAAAAVLLVTALVLLTPWSPGPSRQEILSTIDSRYQTIWAVDAASQTNPFDGNGILESTADENPFQAAGGPAAASLRLDENPFRRLIQQD